MNDESRPEGPAHETTAKLSTGTVPTSDDVATQRRRRRERQFSSEVVAYLEQLDRRREAQWRLQPLADFTSAA